MPRVDEEEENKKHTDLIEFKSVEFGSRLGKKTLCGLAVRAVRFAEDGCIHT